MAWETYENGISSGIVELIYCNLYNSEIKLFAIDINENNGWIMIIFKHYSILEWNILEYLSMVPS